jgi:SHS family lactate transporter-like MFS transporter
VIAGGLSCEKQISELTSIIARLRSGNPACGSILSCSGADDNPWLEELVPVKLTRQRWIRVQQLSRTRFGAGPPVLIIIFRWCLPETNTFLVMKAEREAKAAHTAKLLENDKPRSRAAHMKVFGREAGHAIKTNWVLLAYMVVLLTGFHSISHGSQDLYPTFLKNQAGMSPTQTTVVTAVGQIGAIFGSTLVGYLSTYFGRRLAMIVSVVFGGALVPAYILPRNKSLIASAFFEQFFVGGVFGPIPIHQIELSPPALRSLAVGLTSQLGNLASSASATIESTIGERFPLPLTETGLERFDYGKVIGKFVWVYPFWLLSLWFLTVGCSDFHGCRLGLYSVLRLLGAGDVSG